MTLPLTMPTVLLVTLISVIGSLLAFDQFYIMTAGQPQNQTATSVFYIYLNSFPYLQAGLRRGAVAVLCGHHPGVHGGPDGRSRAGARCETRSDSAAASGLPRCAAQSARRRCAW